MIGKPLIDLTGQRFGKLTALRRGKTERYEGRTNSTIVYWLCRCDCGVHKEIRGLSLRSGGSTSCGCNWRKPKGNVGKIGNLEKKMFGSLTALEFIANDNGNMIYLCQCACGKKTKVRASDLIRGKRKGCCFHKPRKQYKQAKGFMANINNAWAIKDFSKYAVVIVNTATGRILQKHTNSTATSTSHRLIADDGNAYSIASTRLVFAVQNAISPLEIPRNCTIKLDENGSAVVKNFATNVNLKQRVTLTELNEKYISREFDYHEDCYEY